jgi:hypothetical protein
MNDDILDYQIQSQIHARIEYGPADAVPAGLLVVRDANNQVQKKIELTPENIDTWIDLTECVKGVERGIIEAHLTRTLGHGSWTAKLWLWATHPPNLAEDLERGSVNHIDPSVLFRRLP